MPSTTRKALPAFVFRRRAFVSIRVPLFLAAAVAAAVCWLYGPPFAFSCLAGESNVPWVTGGNMGYNAPRCPGNGVLPPCPGGLGGHGGGGHGGGGGGGGGGGSPCESSLHGCDPCGEDDGFHDPDDPGGHGLPDPAGCFLNSPESLPSIGERVRLHMVSGPVTNDVRWGADIGFGPGLRLNYLHKIQLLSNWRVARLFDPVTTDAHVLMREDDPWVFTPMDGSSLGPMRLEAEGMDPAARSAPPSLRLHFPDGAEWLFELEFFEPTPVNQGLLAGPIYRIGTTQN